MSVSRRKRVRIRVSQAVGPMKLAASGGVGPLQIVTPPADSCHSISCYDESVFAIMAGIRGHGYGAGEDSVKMVVWVALLVLISGRLSISATAQTGIAPAEKQGSALPDRVELENMAARFAPTPLRVDTSGLSSGDRQALVKLIQ